MPGALSSRLLVSLDRCQALIIRSNSRICAFSIQLDAESRHTRTGNLRQPLVICVRDDAEQLLDTIASNRCDDAKLRKMSPDGIDHRRLLPDEQMAGPDRKPAFENASGRVGCPDRRIDRLCITCCSPSQPSHHVGCPTRSVTPQARRVPPWTLISPVSRQAASAAVDRRGRRSRRGLALGRLCCGCFHRIFRLVDMATDERHHVSHRALDARQPGIEHELGYARRGLNLGLEHI
jgi:hypothetical protein